MSFLAPLYLAGFLAISLPLIFHLIRRTPQGKQLFSAVMFLSPSPPRLTRRSRLDQWLLLLLRAAALALLALAFARPFLRQAANFDLASGAGRQVAILVDTSASMRQADLWRDAIREADDVLAGLGPRDQVELFSFSDELVPIVRAGDVQAGAEQQRELVRGGVRNLQPGWGATQLGAALAQLADILDAQEREEAKQTPQREIVLISDLQQGSNLEALQSFDWPDQIQLTIRRLEPRSDSNAGLQLITEDTTAGIRMDAVRVRVTNAASSAKERFELHWEGAEEQKPIETYVPPGTTRVVRVPRATEGGDADRVTLRLTGDDQTFDNTLFVAPAQQQQVSVVYVGGDNDDDPDGLLYYLERALVDVSGRTFQLAVHGRDTPLRIPESGRVPLVVATGNVPPERAGELRKYATDGGTILYVLADVADAEALQRLAPEVALQVREAEVQDYRMLGQVNLEHPLFASMADPRFSDFTKVQFWRHRLVEFEDEAAFDVVAKFDNGDPAVLERRLGDGVLLVLTSGWHREDSLLGRSSKFVPMLYAALYRSGALQAAPRQYFVGQAVALHHASTSGRQVVYKPDLGEVSIAREARSFSDTDQPGLYRVRLGDREYPFAVNVPAGESETTPLDPGQLEQFGVTLSRTMTAEERARIQRQMRDVELEGSQRLWKWLIVAALGIVITETWLAGRASRLSGGAQA